MINYIGTKLRYVFLKKPCNKTNQDSCIILNMNFQIFSKTFSKWHTQVAYKPYNSQHDESQIITFVKSTRIKYYQNACHTIKSE